MMLVNPFMVAPSDTSTRLLMHFNGTNGSTTFLDSSPNNWTTTAFATSQLSTSVVKFGSASLSLPVNGDYIQLPYQVGNFGSQDFCVEAWVYPTTRTPYGGIISWNANYVGFSLQWNNDNTIRLLVGNAASTGWAHATQSMITVATNAWTHIAVTREGLAMRVFINGVIAITFNAATTIFPDTSTDFNIGGFGTRFGVGYLDEVRIIKGAAIYTSNFTPPTSPF